MRKLITLVSVMVVVAGMVFAVEYMSTGWGKTVAVTSTTTNIVVGAARKLSVYNTSGSATNLHVLINIATNDFNTRYTDGTTIIVPGGSSFTFDCQNSSKQIDSVTMCSTGDTYNVLIGAF